MKTTLEQVKEFHETFGHTVANKVGEETLETRQLRIKLLFEELQELAEATCCDHTFWSLCRENVTIVGVQGGYKIIAPKFDLEKDVDHVEELDALLDLQVVLDGKFLTSGHWKVKDEAFAEVHRSNMSKSYEGEISSKIMFDIDKHCDLLEQTKGEGMHVTHLISKDQKRIIFVREDGKILKGPDFVEPDLKKFVKRSRTITSTVDTK